MVVEFSTMDHHPESPDSPSYVSSPDVSHKRSTTTKPTSPDNKEKPASVRFLVSNAAAGSVIGKGGSTITEFQSQSGARFQLSRNHEYFPGTTDRIIMISGTVDEILTAMDFILSKLQSELHIEDGDDVDPRLKLRLIVPNSSCGGIIGKAGSTIKVLATKGMAQSAFTIVNKSGQMLQIKLQCLLIPLCLQSTYKCLWFGFQLNRVGRNGIGKKQPSDSSDSNLFSCRLFMSYTQTPALRLPIPSRPIPLVITQESRPFHSKKKKLWSPCLCLDSQNRLSSLVEAALYNISQYHKNNLKLK
ncbi:hypothetical protein AMTRI_Chr07g28890 [Amborella trichopoda]